MNLAKQIIIIIILNLSVTVMALSLQSHTITATLNTTQRTMIIDQTIEWVNTFKHPTSSIMLALDNYSEKKNPYHSDAINDSGYPKGFQSERHNIHSIKHNNATLAYQYIDNKNILKLQKFSTEHNQVLIHLDHVVLPGEAITLHIKSSRLIPNKYKISDSYTFKNHYYLRFRWYPTIYDNNGSAWITTKDTLLRHKMTQFKLTIDKPVTVGISADKINTTRSKSGTLIDASWSYPIHSIALSISDQFKTLTQTDNGTQFDVLYLPNTPKNQAKSILKNTISAYNYYTNTYGKLPYKRIVVTHSSIPGLFGMASNGHIFLGNSAFSPSFKYELTLLNRVYDYIISHEIAHLWSGFDQDFLQNNALSEGLTEYMSYDYLDHSYGKSALLVDSKNEHILNIEPIYGIELVDRLRNHRYLAQKSYQLLLKNEWDQPLSIPFEKSYIGQPKFFKDYHKSALFFSSLEAYIGSSQFKQALRSYTSYNNPDRSFKHLQQELSKTSTKNINQFFNDWVWDHKTLDYSIQNVSSQKTSSAVQTTVTVKKAGTAESSVPIELHYKDGTTKQFTINPTDDLTQIKTITLSPLTSVAIDPDMMILETNRMNNYYPSQVNVYSFQSFITQDKTSLIKRKDTDQYQLYLGIPFVISTPSFFDDVFLFGVQAKGSKLYDHNWSLGFALQQTNNDSENINVFFSWNQYLSKTHTLSALVSSDFDSLNTDIGMIHSLYEHLDVGFYGIYDDTISTISYGFSQWQDLNVSQTYQNLFASYTYANSNTKMAFGNLKFRYAPKLFFKHQFTMIDTSIQTFHRLAKKLIISPKISVTSGSNIPDYLKPSEQSMRGVSIKTYKSTHASIGSIDLLFPIATFENDIQYFLGRIVGIHGAVFWEFGTFDNQLFSFNKNRTYQTIGLEFGFINTFVMETPMTLSIGYAKTISTPTLSDSEIYLNFGLAMNIFSSLYTY